MIQFNEQGFLIGVAVLCILLSVLWRRKHSLSYLVFFAAFWFYLLAVVSVVIFPIVVDPDYPNGKFQLSVNFIPFYFGNCFTTANLCIRSILENILLTVPFGFGINFLLKIKPKNIFWLALFVGGMFELAQLIISIVFRSGFRAIDINDVILNGAGVLVGYGIFRGFAWLYIKLANNFTSSPS